MVIPLLAIKILIVGRRGSSTYFKPDKRRTQSNYRLVYRPFYGNDYWSFGYFKIWQCYLPIDPNYPMERLHFVLEDAQCSLLVSHSSLKEVFRGKEIQTLFIDKLKPSRNKENITFPAYNRNNLAYVIYTSGSSGKPKGVPITHNDILNSTAGRLDFYKESPKAFLLMSSISFDSSKAGIFWTLCTGGNLILTENRIEQDVQKVGGELIEKNQVSHALMLPSLYALILGHVETKRLHTLNTVIVAGEVCTPSLCQLHFTKLPQSKLYNEYGPTELRCGPRRTRLFLQKWRKPLPLVGGE